MPIFRCPRVPLHPFASSPVSRSSIWAWSVMTDNVSRHPSPTHAGPGRKNQPMEESWILVANAPSRARCWRVRWCLARVREIFQRAERERESTLQWHPDRLRNCTARGSRACTPMSRVDGVLDFGQVTSTRPVPERERERESIILSKYCYGIWGSGKLRAQGPLWPHRATNAGSCNDIIDPIPKARLLIWRRWRSHVTHAGLGRFRHRRSMFVTSHRSWSLRKSNFSRERRKNLFLV